MCDYYEYTFKQYLPKVAPYLEQSNFQVGIIWQARRPSSPIRHFRKSEPPCGTDYADN